MSSRSSLLYINFRPEGESSSKPRPAGLGEKPNFCGNEAKNFYEAVVNSTPAGKGKEGECEAVFDRAVRSEKKSRRVEKEKARRSAAITHELANCNSVDFFRACQDGNTTLISKILGAAGSKPHDSAVSYVQAVDAFGWTPLMCAAFAGRVAIIQLILDFCDGTLSSTGHLWWSVVDKKSRSARDLAAIAGHKDAELILTRHEAESVRVMAEQSPDKMALTSRANSDWSDVDSEAEEDGFVRCDLCKEDIRASKQTEHLASTVHRLNVHQHSNDLPPQLYAVPSHNPGYQLMLRDGWKPEKGLGTREDGRKLPIRTQLKRSRAGLGAQEPRYSSGKRISHFSAHDTRSVQSSKAHHKPVRLVRTKKEMERRAERLRRKEIAWRRELTGPSL